MDEIEELKRDIEELKNEVVNLKLDVTHLKATEIVKARNMEDSTLNRHLLKDIFGLLKDSTLIDGMTPITRKMLDDVLRDGELTDIIQYLREGKKIQAIKLVREITGAGLRDAKQIAEKIQEQNKFP